MPEQRQPNPLWVCGVCDEFLGTTGHCVACWHYTITGNDVYGNKVDGLSVEEYYQQKEPHDADAATGKRQQRPAYTGEPQIADERLGTGRRSVSQR